MQRRLGTVTLVVGYGIVAFALVAGTFRLLKPETSVFRGGHPAFGVPAVLIFVGGVGMVRLGRFLRERAIR